jgi:hypothetical protein
MTSEPLDGAVAERPAELLAGKVAHRLGGQPAEVDPPACGVGDADESGRQAVDSLGPPRKAQKGAVAAKPPRGKRKGAQRRLVGPLHVVDGDYQRAVELDLVEDPQELGAHMERLACRLQHASAETTARRSAQELLDDSEVERRLRLVAACGHRDAPAAAESFGEQGGLADARRPAQQEDRWLCLVRPGEGSTDGLELRVTAVDGACGACGSRL